MISIAAIATFADEEIEGRWPRAVSPSEDALVGASVAFHDREMEVLFAGVAPNGVEPIRFQDFPDVVFDVPAVRTLKLHVHGRSAHRAD
jgi:hypothetical protein